MVDGSRTLRPIDSNREKKKVSPPLKLLVTADAPGSSQDLDDALGVLSNLNLDAGAEQMMRMLDTLASCERGMMALVGDAQANIMSSRKSKDKQQKSSRAAAEKLVAKVVCAEDNTENTKPVSRLLTAEVPFSVEASGTLRLLRVGHLLKSAEAGRLAQNARVTVLETRQTNDGTWRAAVALEGSSSVHGWMTLVTKDGVDNAKLLVA